MKLLHPMLSRPPRRVSALPIRQSGFTLVEMLLVMAIFSIVIGASITTFTAGYTAYTRGREGNKLVNELNIIKDEVSTSIRAASMGGGTLTLSGCAPADKCTSIVATGYESSNMPRKLRLTFDAPAEGLYARFDDMAPDVPGDRWIGGDENGDGEVLANETAVKTFFVRCFGSTNAVTPCNGTGGTVWRYGVVIIASRLLDNGGEINLTLLASIIPADAIVAKGAFPF